MPVNIENMTKWVEALESGEYEQGRDRLATILPDGRVKYCCLGVACEVAKRNGLDLEVNDREQDGDSFGIRFYDSTSGILPDSVMEWLGLDSDNPRVPFKDLTFTILSSINDRPDDDEYHGDFPAIAAAIRQEFLPSA